MRSSLWIVEDSDDDYEVLCRAMTKANIPLADVRRCENGMELVEGLQGAEFDPPALLLLDLNMPGMSGHDILGYIKGSDKWRQLPVIVLTTSNNPRDIDQCYELGANAYIQKPMQVSDFVHLVGTIRDFWFNLIERPRLPR